MRHIFCKKPQKLRHFRRHLMQALGFKEHQNMLEAIIGGVVAIALGIAGNILTPHVEDKLRLRSPKNPPKPEILELPSEEASDEDLEAWRAQNRRTLELFWWQVFVYGASFFVMYLAIKIPLNWSAGIGAEGLDFSTTRLGLNFVLSSDKFSLIAVALGIILYIPCWYVAQRIANLVTTFALRYSSVNEIRYGAFVTLGMFFMALIVAGHVIYVLNSTKGYIDSVVLPFIVLLIIGAFASSRR
ncbi:MAG TPA: hypothetical protein ENJ44_05475 [Oceanospirillales bacterium]|nr:hypothetical protein [Oceanospirillales bacterium]